MLERQFHGLLPFDGTNITLLSYYTLTQHACVQSSSSFNNNTTTDDDEDQKDDESNKQETMAFLLLSYGLRPLAWTASCVFG